MAREETCEVCGGPAEEGVCLGCGQREADCDCPPVEEGPPKVLP